MKNKEPLAMKAQHLETEKDKKVTKNLYSKGTAAKINHFNLDGLMLCCCLFFSNSVFAQLLQDDPLQGERCGSCHLAGETVDSSTAFQLTDTQEQLCSRCHPGAIQATHPSGVAHSMSVPLELSLDWKGEVTCSTCHSIHLGGHAPLSVAERGVNFCTLCHQQAFFDQMIDDGLSLFASAHLNALTDYESAQTDPFSVHCLGCHDNWGDSLSAPGEWKNHPVLVRYQCRSCRPAEELSETVLIPGDSVSCVSCHQGYTQNHGMLVVSMEGSGLCLDCHDL
jgi:predicted CXXCH cytochrome family protein